MLIFIILSSIFYGAQLIVAIMFLAMGDPGEAGIENKTQAILFFVFPYYWVFAIGKSVARGIKDLDR